MNREFAYGMEDKGYELLKQYNKFLHIQGLVRTPRNYQACDASGYTTDGTPIVIEIKVRNQKYDGDKVIGKNYTADTIYIEDHKVGSMLLEHVVNKSIPLYVNFLDNAIIVYNLSKLNKRPNITSQKIKSKLYEGIEICKRVELPLDEAFIYDLNNFELIKKPNDK